MYSFKKLIGTATILTISLFISTSPLQAQTYPAKPVKIVVPFPAGGIVDILTRIVTEKVASNWGSPIIVEPKPGAGAAIGTEAVATAAPDGYTFLVASITGAVGPIITPQFKHDLRKDFVAVSMFANAPNVVVVPAALPVSSMAELVDMAKKSPGKMNYSHSGAGSTNHLPVEFLKMSRRLQCCLCRM
jgi:tripartite-type tricarboxylate transporter receptor subunit TctC